MTLSRALPGPAPALVVQTAFLGDVVLSTPLISRLGRERPVDVLTNRSGAGLLANNPAIREIIVFDKRGRDSGARGLLAMSRSIRARRYGSAFHAQGSLRSAALTAMARIPHRVGFETSAGRLLYTRRVHFSGTDHHVARLLSLSPTRGDPLPVPTPRPELYPSAEDRAVVDDLLGTMAGPEPLIALAPGSVWNTKRWPHFNELVALLGASIRFIVIGSGAESGLARDLIAAAAGGTAIDTTGRLSLLQSAELIRRCRAIVTNDSLPLHLASAMNVPTVAIFGPTVPQFGFAPLADRSFVAGVDALTCRPCHRHGPKRCPLGHWRCMRDISPASVERLLRHIIADQS